MKLKQLIQGIDFQRILGPREREISGISADSRAVAFGHLFLAKKGHRVDGSQFMRQAVDAGAAAIVTSLYDPFLPSVTQLIHPHPEEIESQLAASYYSHPSKELFVVGVTGSKGKTTSTYLIRHVLDALMGGAGLSGTIEVMIGEKRYPSLLTTPDVIFHQKMMREMSMQRLSAAVLEVSSLGLVQHRVDGIEWDVALFTNLFPDHLDYHGTKELYAEAKQRLFFQLARSGKKKKRAIVNGDDPYAAWMVEGCKPHSFSFGMGDSVDVRASSIRHTQQGSEFFVEYAHQKVPFFLPLLGLFNVYNALGAICVGLHRGASLEEISSILETMPPVPGRLEKIAQSSHQIQLFVDYAHTGESLRETLKVLKGVAHRRLLVLFGCGGNRDPARRIGMAEAAEAYADLVMITTDNPRQEAPEEIVRQILLGFRDPGKVLQEPDREQAIRALIRCAAPGDLIVIAGKGHERVQIFAHQTVPFEDGDIAKKIFHQEIEE